MEMREVKIENYWPLIVKNTDEFANIAVAENPEFNELTKCIYQVLKDCFILEATEYGVSRWEKMLGLAVTPEMTLDDRKAAILHALSVKIPYTWRVLKQMLTDVLGEGNFELSLNNDTQELTLTYAIPVSETPTEAVDQMVSRVVPRNLLIKYDYDVEALVKILDTRLTSLLGAGNFSLSLNNDTQVLTVGFALDATQTQIDSVKQLIDRVVPQNLVRNYEWMGGYTLVEYLQPNGISYINSLYNPAPGVRINVTFYLINSSNFGLVFGNRRFEDLRLGDSFNCFMANGSWALLDVCAQRYTKNGAAASLREWHSIECSETGIVADGEQKIVSESKFTNQAGSPVYFFAAPEFVRSSNVRLKHVRISDFSGLKRNFVPALDPTGTPCMYDTVTRTAFYNNGTGDFLYPTDAAPVMTTDLDEKFYAKLTEHGVRRLYKVPEGCTLSKDEYAAKHGFKELVEPPMPQTGYWTNVWKETDTQLICEWVETEPPMEVTEND